MHLINAIRNKNGKIIKFKTTKYGQIWDFKSGSQGVQKPTTAPPLLYVGCLYDGPDSAFQ